ncbi:ATP-binding protein [Chryseolinea sp. T2]|uniref:ATP-binding protein n=1 Tax=Chryseolinea sp. T2 TaxID=3129255 RepID=UPI00307871C6
MKISHIIFLSFFVILLLFSITTFINYRQSELINSNAEEFSRSSTVLRSGNRFQRNFLNMVSGLRGYILTNETFFIQTYDSAIIENESILDEMADLVPDKSDQRILLDDIRELQKYWVTDLAMPLLDAKKNSGESDSSKVAFNKLYKEKIVEGLEKDVQRSLQQKFSDFSNYEYGLRDSRKEELAASVSNTRSISFSLTLISIIAGIMIALFIANYISGRIVKMVTMANAIAEGNYNVHLPDRGKSEMSQLARALNHMADLLHTNFTLLKRQRDELDQFAHIVSHDIKAPLRGIDNVVTWIEEDHSFDLPAKVKEYLDLIKGRVVRAENLLKGILDYARIGREVRDTELVDITELVTEITEDIPKRAGINFRVQQNMPIIATERVPLLQIFANLISNAVKYHDKVDGFVKIYYQSNGSHYEFFVEDNGPGIDKIYHEKIFMIFQTLEARDSFESTGVGLAIVKKILDDRNLLIKVQSAPGEGSVFSFAWPKKYQDAESD